MLLETSDYTQMRRCRLAFLHGEIVDEMFDGGVCARGFVVAVRADLKTRPLRWTVSIEHKMARRPTRALQDQDGAAA